MHANPQRLQDQAPYPTLRLIEAPADTSLASLIFRFLNLLRKAVWRAFQHDAFAIAKASAYSSILTFFPTLLVLGSVLASRRNTQAVSHEISDALTKIMPAGAATVQAHIYSNYVVALLFDKGRCERAINAAAHTDYHTRHGFARFPESCCRCHWPLPRPRSSHAALKLSAIRSIICHGYELIKRAAYASATLSHPAACLSVLSNTALSAVYQ